MNNCKNHNDDKKSIAPVQPTDQASMIDREDLPKPKHKHKGHMLHMILCCGLPLLILLVLPLLGYKGVLLSIAPFICPIMMLVMIPMMMKGHGSSCHNNSTHTESRPIEEKQE